MTDYVLQQAEITSGRGRYVRPTP